MGENFEKMLTSFMKAAFLELFNKESMLRKGVTLFFLSFIHRELTAATSCWSKMATLHSGEKDYWSYLKKEKKTINIKF